MFLYEVSTKYEIRLTLSTIVFLDLGFVPLCLNIYFLNVILEFIHVNFAPKKI
jgi:hypothetical protein